MLLSLQTLLAADCCSEGGRTSVSKYQDAALKVLVRIESIERLGLETNLETQNKFRMKEISTASRPNQLFSRCFVRLGI